MLDVHPPHAPTHSWKDFFIHAGTICVGLLIAVGLEQTVETIHHRHQRHELEAAGALCDRCIPALAGRVDGREIEWHDRLIAGRRSAGVRRLDHEADVIAQETSLKGAKSILFRFNQSRQGLPVSKAVYLTLAQREAFLQASATLSVALRIMIVLQLNEGGACRGVLHGAHSVDAMLQFMLEEDKRASEF